MITSCKNSIYVLICQRSQVSEASPRLCITQTKLAIRVASTDKYIASLRQDDRMILTSRDCLDSFAKEVMDKLWLEDILTGSLPKLSLLSVAESVKLTVEREYH